MDTLLVISAIVLHQMVAISRPRTRQECRKRQPDSTSSFYWLLHAACAIDVTVANSNDEDGTYCSQRRHFRSHQPCRNYPHLHYSTQKTLSLFAGLVASAAITTAAVLRS